MRQEYKTIPPEGVGLVKSIFKSEAQERGKALEKAILTVLCRELSNEFNMYGVK